MALPNQLTYRMDAYGYGDSWNEALNQDIFIGNCLRQWQNSTAWPVLNEYLEPNVTQSPLEARQQKSMCLKKIQPYPIQDSNWDQSRFNEIRLRIGWMCCKELKIANLTVYRQMFSFVATATCDESLLTLQHLWRLNERFMCSGGRLEQASLEGPGQKPVWTHTLNVQTPNFGAVTMAIQMLLSMSTVEQLAYQTSSDGSTDIQFLLKSKDPPLFSEQQLSGSPQTSIPEIGTPTWTSLRRRLFSDA